jgi:hypothetical protein
MGNRWAFRAFCVLALAGCPTVDLGDSPADIGLCNPPAGLSYFMTQIEPNYFKLTDTVNGCARSSSCHDGNNGLTLDPTGSDAANYRISQSYLNCGDAMASELLTKPLAGIDGHGGGDLFTQSDPQFTVFMNWFCDGSNCPTN